MIKSTREFSWQHPEKKKRRKEEDEQKEFPPGVVE